jgi:hypothetical protein
MRHPDSGQGQAAPCDGTKAQAFSPMLRSSLHASTDSEPATSPTTAALRKTLQTSGPEQEWPWRACHSAVSTLFHS